MSTGNGNGNGKRPKCPGCAAGEHTPEELREFHPIRAEWEKELKRIGGGFTKEPNSRLEAVMHDEDLTADERVMAWIMRMSSGNYSLRCITKPDGEFAYQSDCAGDLNLPKQTVSRVVDERRKRGYVYLPDPEQPKVLYPVLRPAPVALQKVPHSIDFSTFSTQWGVSHSNDWEQLQVARSVVEKINKVILSDYREYRRAATKNGAYKEQSSKSYESSGSAAASQVYINDEGSSSSSTPEEKRRRTTTSSTNSQTGTATARAREPEAPVTDLQEVAEAMATYGPTDDTAARKLVRLCLEQSPDATVTEVVAVIHEKGPQANSRETATGFLLKAVPKQFEPVAFERWRRDRANPQNRLIAAGGTPDKNQKRREEVNNGLKILDEIRKGG